MATNYIANVHKPTAVSDAVCGYFFHNSYPNLIVAKSNLLEFYSIIVDQNSKSVRLQLDKDFQVFGEIVSLKLIQANSRGLPSKNLLFFITNKQHVAFIEPSCDDGSTSANGSSTSRISSIKKQPIVEDEPEDSDDTSSLSAALQFDQQIFNNGNSLNQVNKADINRNSSKFVNLKHRFEYKPVSYISTFINENVPRFKTLPISRSRSCSARIVNDKLCAIKKCHKTSNEFSYLKGPFWSELDTKNIMFAKHVLSCAKNNHLNNNPISKSAISWLLTNLPKDLIQRLCNLKPNLNSQFDEYQRINRTDQVCTNHLDVEMDYNEVKEKDDYNVIKTSLFKDMYTMSDERFIACLDTYIASFENASTSEQCDKYSIDNCYINQRISFHRQLLHAQISNSYQHNQFDSGQQLSSHTIRILKESIDTFLQCTLHTLPANIDNCENENLPTEQSASLYADKLIRLGCHASDSDMTDHNDHYDRKQQELILRSHLHLIRLPFNFHLSDEHGHVSVVLNSNIIDGNNDLLCGSIPLVLSLRRLMESRHNSNMSANKNIHDYDIINYSHSLPPHKLSPDKVKSRRRRTRSADYEDSERIRINRKVNAIRVFTHDTVSSCAEPFEGFNGYHHLRTRASGRIKDRSGRPTENGIICAISHDHAVIALNLIVGAMKFIAVKATLNNSEGFIEHFNARIDSSTVVNMQFINSFSSIQTSRASNKKRTLCVIFKDLNKTSKVCVYELSLREKYLRLNDTIHNPTDESCNSDSNRRGKIARVSNIAWEMNMHSSLIYDTTTHLVIPTIFGGVLFLGHETVTFYPKLLVNETIGNQTEADQAARFSGSDCLRKEYDQPNFRYARCWCSLESDKSNDLRFLVCEQSGCLLLIRISLSPVASSRSKFLKTKTDNNENKFCLNIDYLGSVTNASVMIPLPYNHFFLGSKHGDHQLIRLEPSSRYRSGASSNRCPFRSVQIVKSFYSLAPIMDMRFVPTKLAPHTFDRPALKYRLIDSINSLECKSSLKTILQKCCFNENNRIDCDKSKCNSTLYQETLVTCSNVAGQGSLRFIRSGLGLSEKICCKCPQLQAAFCLSNFLPEFVLLSYPTISRLMKIKCKDQTVLLDQYNIFNHNVSCEFVKNYKSFDLDFDSHTLIVEQESSMLCQLTTRQIRLFSNKSLKRAVSKWSPGMCSTITNAAACLSTGTIVACVGSNVLIRITISSKERKPLQLITACERSFGNDFISSIAIDKVDNEFVACGLWMKGTIYLLHMIDLTTLMLIDSACIQPYIAHCICFVEMNNFLHLVVGDSGGNVSYISLNSLLGSKTNWDRIKLPCPPQFIQPIQIENLSYKLSTSLITQALFIGCEYSTVMYISKRGKTRLVNVNCQDIVHMHSWPHDKKDLMIITRKSGGYSDKSSLENLIYNEMELCICSLDSLNKIYMNTLKLNETAHRITYHCTSDNLITLVYHSLPSPKQNLHVINSQLSQYSSYRAPSLRQADTSIDANGGKPFAVDVLESQFHISRPAVKRKSKDDVTDFDQSDDTLFSERNYNICEDQMEMTGTGDQVKRRQTNIDSSILEKWLEREEHAIILIDRVNLKLKCSYFLKPYEHGCSLCTFKSKNRLDIEYVVVGTGFVFEGDIEPKSGRILIFEITDSFASKHCLTLISETKVDGAVYSMSSMNGCLVATVNCRVKLYGFTKENTSNVGAPVGLTLHDCHSSNSLALYVKCKHNRCLVGDLLRSVELFEMIDDKHTPITNIGEQDAFKLKFNQNDDIFKLTRIARDYNPNWITSIEVIEPDIFAATENFNNLFMCTLSSNNEDMTASDVTTTQTEPELPQSIREVSLIYLGQLINVICSGRLVGTLNRNWHESYSINTDKQYNGNERGQLFNCGKTFDMCSHLKSHHLLGSTSGWIGQLIPISQKLYVPLWEIQKRLQMYVKSIGRISHGDWRAFESEMRIEASSGFIDGSLIESLVGLPLERILDVLKGMRFDNTYINRTSQLEPLLNLLEDLSNEH